VLNRLWPVDAASCFADLLQAIDAADQEQVGQCTRGAALTFDNQGT
jgi:hypothetical protein